MKSLQNWKTWLLMGLLALLIACAPKRRETEFSKNKAAEAGQTYTEDQLRSAIGSDKYDQLVTGVGADNLNLLTYRESANEDGFFMLLVQPPVTLADEEIIPRDIIVVLDQSGDLSELAVLPTHARHRRAGLRVHHEIVGVADGHGAAVEGVTDASQLGERALTIGRDRGLRLVESFAENLLGAVPLQGVPMRPSTRYALVVTRALRDASGRAFAPSNTLSALRRGTAVAGLSEAASREYAGALNALRASPGIGHDGPMSAIDRPTSASAGYPRLAAAAAFT